METAHSIFALNVKSQAPFVFAISAGRSDGDGPAVNASDLAGQLDATAKKVTFHRGDCTLQLTKTELGIDVAQQGACTTLGVPSTFTLEASLDPMTDVCWDSSVRSFKVPGTCQPSAGF